MVSPPTRHTYTSTSPTHITPNGRHIKPHLADAYALNSATHSPNSPNTHTHTHTHQTRPRTSRRHTSHGQSSTECQSVGTGAYGGERGNQCAHPWDLQDLLNVHRDTAACSGGSDEHKASISISQEFPIPKLSCMWTPLRWLGPPRQSWVPSSKECRGLPALCRPLIGYITHEPCRFQSLVVSDEYGHVALAVLGFSERGRSPNGHMTRTISHPRSVEASKSRHAPRRPPQNAHHPLSENLSP